MESTGLLSYAKQSNGTGLVKFRTSELIYRNDTNVTIFIKLVDTDMASKDYAFNLTVKGQPVIVPWVPP